MGRIILSAGHDLRDPGAVALGTTESKEMRLTRDLVAKELKARGADFISVPDYLSLTGTIRWVNANAVPGDVAIDLHGNAFNGSVRGAEAFYIAKNTQRQKDAQILLDALLKAVPGLPSRGAKPDTVTMHRSGLAFCRRIAVASLLLELCFIDNREDLKLLQTYRDKFAQGIADGLIAWNSRNLKQREFPLINIRVKDNEYEEKGVLVNNNSYIPSDLVELLGIKVASLPEIRQISYGNIVYIKAIDLQKFDIAIAWENQTRTVVLDLRPRTELSGSEQIMGLGNTTASELKSFIESNNENALAKFPDLPELYIQESELEGVNHDIAFCQMCLHTNYLRFDGRIKPDQNNFCGLGSADGSPSGASFPDPKTGVTAQIQHLKAYASNDLIKQQPIVDPRFDFVPRGVAPSIYGLGRRWLPDPHYGDKIKSIMMRLYGVF
ncbi:MAG: cell wall hydrolase [Symploca sp. SIO3C6]|uniref:Cell wall hydrolase n=1 Tax=Symploca sp. SIO1C4 TaxID=2607765 RepID=A0A6B3NGC5_9CYAN|nr:cell wall hydrolase [Symploca sp. SIO3C6]NER30723.1 cell wall hydrolase [Symploca sp. SIO1C4]